jgi:hypothetical protein
VPRPLPRGDAEQAHRGGRWTSRSRESTLARTYERIIVRGTEFVGARLTPEAYSLGLALALPERVQPAKEWVLARPTGVGRAITTYSMPIEGRDEWLAAARRLA